MPSPEQNRWLREHSNQKLNDQSFINSIVAGEMRQAGLSMDVIVPLLSPDSSPENAKASTASAASHETDEGSDLGFCRDVVINPQRRGV